MIHKRSSLNKGKVIVTFEIPGSIWAERINLVGDFNDWDQESLPFRQNREGNWEIELELEAGRGYRFRYLLDGEHWRDDWHADSYAPNPYGSHDSIIIAKVPPEA
jgi:1,4-alpha-glucan branching enzyme